jgi:hypothetical protein
MESIKLLVESLSISNVAKSVLYGYYATARFQDTIYYTQPELETLYSLLDEPSTAMKMTVRNVLRSVIKIGRDERWAEHVKTGGFNSPKN